ncbi:MAG TPA: SMP-30/gluconolactonase/LRE family protein, partial [Geminicoccaceae bacterium]|nr:SMP-30/gluconolactonase/LRE family protein [Geminicoccaceae bacterium]
MRGLAIGLADLGFVGRGLARPECVVATASGDAFVSDRRGGITRLAADGTQELILARGVPDFLPNGFSLLQDRSFAIANLGPEGGAWRMLPDGALVPEVLEVDGMRLPATNFVNADRSGGELRLWVSVSTRHVPRERAFRREVADGYIVLKDRKGTRIVADGLGFTNENKVDPSGRFLYVNETMARRLSRFAIRDGAALSPRETVAEFGAGTLPDGFEFDAEGGIWIASVVSNRLLRIAQDRTQTVVLEDSDPEVVVAVERKYQESGLARADIDAGRESVLGNL